MPPFPKPGFTYPYHTSSQLDALGEHRATKPGRDIPFKSKDNLLIGTWNLANLGVQERRDKDYRLIAELVSWFDLVAIQEVSDTLRGLRGIQKQLPRMYSVLTSDVAGNNERLAFLYDEEKVSLMEVVGEVAVPPSHQRHIKLPMTEQKFRGFDRNPYLATFQSDSFTFLVVNAHIYFGSESTVSMNRRSLETYALARWADLRRKSDHAYTRDIIALGDFNLPKTEPGDPVYEALTSRGLHIPSHSTEIGSSIKTDSHYDQIAFFPGQTSEEFKQSGVFDFDGALFTHLWETRTPEEFFQYMRYYISDHRLLWAEFNL